jgi:hypothetical protein
LFVVAADLLQSVINDAYAQGALSAPFPQNSDMAFPVIQHADDTIIVMPGDEQQLATLKGLLQNFTLSTSLRVNYHKSCLVLINMESGKATDLAYIFGCIVGSFPFTYLGLPLGLTKPLVKDYAPLVCRVERRLSTSAQFLSYAGRL